VDAVALDYLLPGMNGEEAARRIRAACANTIVIILCSGGFSAPQPVVDVFNASVSKGKGIGGPPGSPGAAASALCKAKQIAGGPRPLRPHCLGFNAEM